MKKIEHFFQLLFEYRTKVLEIKCQFEKYKVTVWEAYEVAKTELKILYLEKAKELGALSDKLDSKESTRIIIACVLFGALIGFGITLLLNK